MSKGRRLYGKNQHDIHLQVCINEEEQRMLWNLQNYYGYCASDIIRMLIKNEYLLINFWNAEKGNEHPWVEKGNENGSG